MLRLWMTLAALLQRDEHDGGATMVEYGLIVAFIALVALVGVKLLGTNLDSLFNSVASAL